MTPEMIAQCRNESPEVIVAHLKGRTLYQYLQLTDPRAQQLYLLVAKYAPTQRTMVPLDLVREKLQAPRSAMRDAAYFNNRILHPTIELINDSTSFGLTVTILRASRNSVFGYRFQAAMLMDEENLRIRQAIFEQNQRWMEQALACYGKRKYKCPASPGADICRICQQFLLYPKK